MSARACPACLGRHARPAFVGRDWALGAAPGEFAYVACTACATVFVQPLPPEETIAAAYGPGYANYAQPGRLERLLEPLARREARRLLRYADPDSSLLELGCGTGRFVERLKAVGWRGPLAGLEHSPAVAAAAAERLGIPIEAGDAESVELSAGTQGAIVLRHVLEHLRDPAATLERVRAALAPDGVLYLATPDRDALAARVFGRWWWGWEVPRHLAVFSPASLRLLLRRCGFSVEAEWWDPDPHMWAASLWLALDRGRHRRWTRIAAHPANPLVTVPAIAFAGAATVRHRSTMYSVLARPVPVAGA